MLLATGPGSAGSDAQRDNTDHTLPELSSANLVSAPASLGDPLPHQQSASKSSSLAAIDPGSEQSCQVRSGCNLNAVNRIDSNSTISKLATGGNNGPSFTDASTNNHSKYEDSSLGPCVSPVVSGTCTYHCINGNSSVEEGNRCVTANHQDRTIASSSRETSPGSSNNHSPGSASIVSINGSSAISSIIPAGTTEELRRFLLSTYDTLSREVGNLLDTGQPPQKVWEHEPPGILKKVGCTGQPTQARGVRSKKTRSFLALKYHGNTVVKAILGNRASHGAQK